MQNSFLEKLFLQSTLSSEEVALQKCSQEKAFRKYAANLQASTHAEVWFQ